MLCYVILNLQMKNGNILIPLTRISTYDSTYDSDFWFSLGHKRSYYSAYDSTTSENQP